MKEERIGVPIAVVDIQDIIVIKLASRIAHEASIGIGDVNGELMIIIPTPTPAPLNRN